MDFTLKIHFAREEDANGINMFLQHVESCQELFTLYASIQERLYGTSIGGALNHHALASLPPDTAVEFHSDYRIFAKVTDTIFFHIIPAYSDRVTRFA